MNLRFISVLSVLLKRNLHYDGAAPDAFFLMGTGNKPHEYGTKIPDENGRYQILNLFLRFTANKC
jgi:hypothetical protein